MTLYVQPGEKIDYTNSSDTKIEYMDIVAGTNKLFVAAEDIPAGGTGAVYTEGVFEMAAKKTDVFTFGQMLYYDSTHEYLTSTVGSNKFFGYATKAKTNTEEVITAKLTNCASS